MSKGSELKTHRQAEGLSQTQVAHKLHVTRQTVSSWEQDRTVPDTDSLKQLDKLYHQSHLQPDAQQSDEGLLLLILTLVSFVIMPFGLIAAPVIIKRNQKTNSYYRLIYLLASLSLLVNLVILAAIILARLNWGITSYREDR